jgi:hypothetical protein
MLNSHIITTAWDEQRTTWGDFVDARYGMISTVNLIRKLGELAFLARIFI